MAMSLPRSNRPTAGDKRESDLVQFSAQTVSILGSQIGIMTSMMNSLKNIEEMMTASLNLGLRSDAANKKLQQSQELEALENKRERKKSFAGNALGSIASTAAKLGLKGMLGAILFGFGMELLDWGKKIGDWTEIFIESIADIQTKLNKWGDKVKELTGSTVLGGLVKSLLVLAPAFAALSYVLGPARLLGVVIKPLGLLIDLFKGIGKAGPELKALDGAKMLRFVKVFGKFLGVVGIAITLIEGLIGGVQGAIAGYEKGGVLGAITGFLGGFLGGIVTGILELLQSISVWVLDALGFDKLAAALGDLDPGKVVASLGAQIGGVFDKIGSAIGGFFDWIMNYDYMGLISGIIDKIPIPEGMKQQAKTALKTALAVGGMAIDSTAEAVRGAASSLGNMVDGWDSAAAAHIDKNSATMNFGRNEAGGGGPRSRGGARRPAAVTGDMMGGTSDSAKTAVSGGGATFEESVKHVLSHEGGYVNDPDDPGGETKYGISKRAYPNLDIANLTREDAKAIYKRDYWDAIGADNLPASVRYAAFDTAVNMGVGAAKKLLRESGNDLTEFTRLRRARYDSIIASKPSSEKYRKGWMNRVDDVTRISAQMAAAPTPSTQSGANLSNSSAAVASAASSGAGAAVIAPVNAARTNVNNTTHHHQSNISASTPVEFAPFLV